MLGALFGWLKFLAFAYFVLFYLPDVPWGWGPQDDKLEDIEEEPEQEEEEERQPDEVIQTRFGPRTVAEAMAPVPDDASLIFARLGSQLGDAKLGRKRRKNGRMRS